ncbi:MAG: hypothetical protein ACYSW8_26525 [Planctomycetota bacterium]|jgi:hypothetical protein
MSGYNDETAFLHGISAVTLDADRTIFAAGTKLYLARIIASSKAGVYNVVIQDGDTNVIEYVRCNVDSGVFEYNCVLTNGLILDTPVPSANVSVTVFYYTDAHA